MSEVEELRTLLEKAELEIIYLTRIMTRMEKRLLL